MVIVKRNTNNNENIENIILFIMNKHFNDNFFQILEVVDVNYFYVKILLETNGHKIYIKYSKSNFFLDKDFSINWVLQDLNICNKTIVSGYLRIYEIFYNITTCETLNTLKESFTFKNKVNDFVFDFIKKFNSLSVKSNDQIFSFENFIKNKVNFNLFFPFIKPKDINNFNEIACCYSLIREELIEKFNSCNFDFDQKILNHGDLKNENIFMDEDKIILTDFENAFWGDNVTDLCVYFINTNQSNLDFMSYLEKDKAFNYEKYSILYEICFLRKSLDLIIDIIFCYLSPEKRIKNQLSLNNLKINFFSKINEIKKTTPFLLNFINHSNVLLIGLFSSLCIPLLKTSLQFLEYFL